MKCAERGSSGDLGAMRVLQVIARLKDEVVTGMNPKEAPLDEPMVTAVGSYRADKIVSNLHIPGGASSRTTVSRARLSQLVAKESGLD